MTPEVKERIDQIRNGNVPEGYKKTGVGIIPGSWDLCALNTVMGNLDAGTSVNSDPTQDTGYYILKTSAVHQGWVDLNEAKSVIEADIGRLRCPVRQGRIMISRMNTPALVGECGYITKSSDVHFLPDRLWQAENISPDTCEFLWLNSLLNSDRYRAAIHSMATGTSNSMKNISKENFLGLTLAMPVLDEQQKISEILSAQDKIIRVKEKLLVEKQRQKKYLMQELLTGKKRLPGFTEDWKTAPIGDFLESRNTKQVPSEEAPLMAFVAGEGVTSKGERYDRSHLVKDDAKKYKRTELDDFIYSSNNLDVGSIGLNKYGTAVISVVYEIFKMKANVVPAVVSEVIQMPRNMHHILSYRQGAFYGQYRIFAEDFLSVPIRMPGHEEQVAIGEVLYAADREIELLRQDLEQEKQKKKALMQLLLTGIVRVTAE